LRILGISGSLRRQSHNTKLLRNAEELLPPDAEFELWQDLKVVPPYDEEDDVEPAPPAVATLKHAIAEADGILFATPEYNSSVPGQLKNALDWASRPAGKSPLRNKPVAVIGASTGAFGAIWAQAELRKVLAATGARVVDAELAIGHADSRFDEEGRLVDASFREELEETLDTLVDAITARAPADAPPVAA
jgi:chromate reductase, NAD(P)H dehydrogenase (quinone)